MKARERENGIGTWSGCGGAQAKESGRNREGERSRAEGGLGEGAREGEWDQHMELPAHSFGQGKNQEEEE